MVDDFPIVREGLQHLLLRQPGLESCGEAGSAAEARRALPRARADLVVLEPGLAGGDGLLLIRALRVDFPTVGVLAYSRLPEAPYAERVVRAGAQGFVRKGDSLDTLLEAIRLVLRGGVHIRAEVMVRATRDPSVTGVAALSDRELEVFRLLGEGRTSREVGDSLGVSIKTIGTHRSNIMKKLGLRSAAQLLHRAIEWSSGGGRSGPDPQPG